MKILLILVSLLLILGCTESKSITSYYNTPQPVNFNAEQLSCGVVFSWTCELSSDTSWWFHVQYLSISNQQWITIPGDSLSTEILFDPTNPYWIILYGNTHQFRVVSVLENSYIESESNTDTAYILCGL